ncbi:uncharacterized protein PHA67_001239 isoform 2-T2 [Liasis olivaceus]
MSNQRYGRRARIKETFCCLKAKGDVLNPPQQKQHEESHINKNSHIAPGSDIQQVQDSPSRRERSAKDIGNQDTEATYQKRIHELEHELDIATKNSSKLSCQLNEMDHLVFPELSECTQLNLPERLKVYLECQMVEKQELERRAIAAEKTLVELEHTVTVLQRQLQDAGCSSAQPGENHQPTSSPFQPFSPTQASSRFFKINKKPAEKTTASNLQKQGNAVIPKQKLMKKRLVKIHRRALPKPATRPREVCLSRVEGQCTEHKKDLSQTVSSPEADSHKSMLQFPEASTTGKNHRSGASGYEQAQVHKDYDDYVHKRVQEEDTLSTASTLPMATPLSRRRRRRRRRDYVHEIFYHSSVNQEPHIKNLVLEKSEVENFSRSSNVSLLSGEGCKENENPECINNNLIDSTNHKISQKPEVSIDLPQPAAWTTKSIRNPQVTSPFTGMSPLEDDSLSCSTVHRSDTTVALKPTTSQILPAEETPCSTDFLQQNAEKTTSVSKLSVSPVKTEEKEFSLERNEANVQLPSTSIKSLETKTNYI